MENNGRKKALRRLFRNRSLVIGGALFAAILAVIFALPLFMPLDPLEMRYDLMLMPPGEGGLLGTDDMGRDLFARIVAGGQASILIGLSVMIATAAAGTVIALFSGYYPAVDMVMMRLMDVMMSFPALLLAIALLAVFQNSPAGVVLALTAVYTPRTARMVRASVLTLKNETYVEAAKAIGVRDRFILFRHILPGAVPVLIVQESFLFAYAILAEAGISFVGVGIQPPTPSWGNILGDARALMREAPWLVFGPGFAIMLCVLSLNLLGDGLREALDPRRKKLTTTLC